MIVTITALISINVFLLFRIDVMNDFVSYRESHKKKGKDYHDFFIESPHTAMLWLLEQRTLKKILRKHFVSGGPQYLDFACGTGRILAFMEELVESATGVDVSTSMLEMARTNVESATIIEADITRDNALEKMKFDLITAFRFFPNAEPQLREEVITALVKHLDTNGLLVFNNHMTNISLARTFMRLFGKGKGHTMSDAEVRQLASDAGLEVVNKYPLGILPLNDKFMLPLGWLISKIESVLSLIPGISFLAQDIIYVCKLR